jgi:hypothetical protein
VQQLAGHAAYRDSKDTGLEITLRDALAGDACLLDQARRLAHQNKRDNCRRDRNSLADHGCDRKTEELKHQSKRRAGNDDERAKLRS